MSDPNSPRWRRPIIFDVHHGERRLFWNELDDEQRFAELNYEAEKNRGILAELLELKQR